MQRWEKVLELCMCTGALGWNDGQEMRQSRIKRVLTSGRREVPAIRSTSTIRVPHQI